MRDEELKKLEHKYIMQSYTRSDVIFDRGEGCYLYDTQGKRYLDFVAGVAVCVIGHANSEVAKAVSDQVGKLITVSDLYYTVPQILLAEKLAKLSGLQKTFFCHSGAEANEAAIKLAKKITGKTHFIAFKNAFHGRTTGSLALTWKKEIREPFMPLAPEVTFVDFGDASAVEAAITEDTAGVFVEPIQGESGIIVPPSGFLSEIRRICSEKSILMIADEVQTGVGRTGKFLACEHENVKPDIVTLAKGLGNGIPIGVCLSDYEFGPGEHGSTLSGNAVSCAAALATLQYMDKHRIIKNAEETGAYLLKSLDSLKKNNPMISEVRGKGLMVAIALKEKKANEISINCLKLGLICNVPSADVIRFVPPLIIAKKQVDDAIEILRKAMES